MLLDQKQAGRQAGKQTDEQTSKRSMVWMCEGVKKMSEGERYPFAVLIT
jgi:hypothetical protein